MNTLRSGNKVLRSDLGLEFLSRHGRIIEETSVAINDFIPQWGSWRNFEKTYFQPQTYFLNLLAVICSLP